MNAVRTPLREIEQFGNVLHVLRSQNLQTVMRLTDMVAQTRRIAFDAAFGPMTAFEEMRRTHLAAVTQIASLTQSFRDNAGLTSAIVESFRRQSQISEELSRIANLSFHIPNQLSAQMSEIVRDAIEAQQRMSDQVAKVMKLAGLPAQFQGLQSLMEQIKGLHLSDFDALAAELEARDEAFSELGDDPDFDRAAERFKREVLDAPDFQRGNLIVQFNFLGSYAAKQREPWLRKFAYDLMNNVLANIVVAIASFSVGLLCHEPGMSDKQLVSAIEKALEKTKLSVPQYRSIRRTAEVKTSRRVTAKTVATLGVGFEVRLIKKSGRWSEVEWQSDPQSEAVLHGWVRSKYLQRLNDKHHGGEDDDTRLLEDDDR